MSIAYVCGFVVGILCVAAVFALIGFLWKKKHGAAYGTYDERQILARGNAYKKGFFCLIIYEMVIGCIELATGWKLFADQMTASFIGIILAVTVFALQCIMKDAYCSLSEKAGSVALLMFGLGVWNLVVAIINYSNGRAFITDGRLNFHSLNILVFVMTVIVGIANLVKLHQNKQEAGEEI